MYLFRILFFIFSVLFGFAFIANQIPQEQSEPPKEEKFDASLVATKADVVAIGQKIFFGKGQCALCHSIGGGTAGRCPNLEGIGGKLTRAFEYESYTQPEAAVYLDYVGSPGEAPKRFAARMPPINKSPIGLTEAEMLTVFAFLQSQAMAMDQIDITPEEVIALGAGPKAEGVMEVVHGNADAGAALFSKLECATCHKIGAAEGGDQGPELVAALTDKNSGYVRSALFEKSEKHENLDEKMTVREMNDLMSYLLSLSAPSAPAAPAVVPAADAPPAEAAPSDQAPAPAAAEGGMSKLTAADRSGKYASWWGGF
jgi:cytochrome c2